MPTAFRHRLRFVRPGDPGTAGIVSTPDQQLLGNTQHLKERLDAADAGRALYLYNAAVAPESLVGQPLYWNELNQRFEPAVARAEVGATGYASQSEESTVIGLLAAKTTAISGTLLHGGIAELSLDNAVDGVQGDGRYYLSATEPGKLTPTRPGVAIPVLYKLGDQVLVTPVFRDFAEDHVHFSFALTAEPAGHHVIPLQPGERHQITQADSNLPGWLPADHASFNNRAPAGAAFGYNLAAHAALQGAWPPIPLEAARMVWDKGENLVGGTEVPLGPDGLVVLDRHGIWWMSDCYGDVPWPLHFTASTSLGGVSASIECERLETMRLTLDFVRMSFATQRSMVTSLVSNSSKLSIRDCDGNEGRTGDLEIDLLLGLLVDEGDDAEGSLVIKEFDPASETFFRGRVLEGLIAGANTTLTSTHSRIDGSGNTIHQGVVQVLSAVDPNGVDFKPTLLRIGDLRERFADGVMYLAFMPNQTSTLFGQVDLPPLALAAGTPVKLQLTLVATASGSIPDLNLTILVVPRATTTPATLPTAETNVTLSPSGSVSANQYFLVDSEAFAVNPGDTVFYTVTRTTGDGYAGEIGVLRQGLVISS
jgi:hypothetical protein